MHELLQAASALDGWSTSAPLGLERFLVLNPGYHDGERGSFLLLPADFCEATLLEPMGILRGDVLATPLGRLLTVTDRGVVLTHSTSHRMANVTCDVLDQLSPVDGSTTFRSLDDAARAGGWIVPWADFDAVMSVFAEEHSMQSSHSQLMKLPAGSMQSRGGNS